MKKIKNRLLLIFILLIGITINVKAESFDYYLSTSEQNYEYVDRNSIQNITVKRGDVINVMAIINNVNNVNNYQINGGKLTIRWDNQYVSLQEVNGKYYNDAITDISGLTINSVNVGNNKLTIGEISSTGFLKSGKNKIIEFKFKVLDSAPTGNFRIYQMDGEDVLKCFNTTLDSSIKCGDSLYSELKYTVAKSNINKLSSIKINGMELDYFNEDINNYDFEVDSNVEEVNIEVTKKDSKSTISGNYGNNPIKYGDNKLVINVISESGDRNTYYLNIKRTDLRSNVNTLNTLTLSAGEINFNPTITEYNITVENEIDKITITSSLSDEKAKYVEGFSNREVELIEGSNKFEIKVLSERGEERTYTLNINRSLSSNNSLKSLKVNDEKIKLIENEFIYNFIVDNEVSEVVIKAEPNDSKATVKLNDSYPLEIGDNEISIVVTAADGKEASYILNITRNKLLSKDSFLTSIKIEGYNINFKPTETLYNLKIKDEDDELVITTTQEDPNATVVIEGNKDLTDGSIIKINVKAEDGSFTRYFINIEKGSSGISTIVIIIIILAILLALCVGIIFYRKKKNENNKFDKLDDDNNSKTNDNEKEINREDVPSNPEANNEELQKANELAQDNDSENKALETNTEEVSLNPEANNEELPKTNELAQDNDSEIENNVTEEVNREEVDKVVNTSEEVPLNNDEISNKESSSDNN